MNNFKQFPFWSKTSFRCFGPLQTHKFLLASSPPINNCNVQSRPNCHRASVTRIKRGTFPKHYNTLLCLQDGSTVTIRTKEPYKILVVPDNLESMTEEEKKTRFGKRKPIRDVLLKDDVDDDFDAANYV